MSFGPAPEADRYLSVLDGEEVETRVSASRFLSQCFRVDDEAAARERLERVRRRHYDATHHCSAWRVGSPTEVLERGDDDGEPSQTAGRPILQAIQAQTLFDTLVVVTRYFGGRKLGTGGLVRAYGTAATTGLSAAPRVERILRTRILLRCAFEDVGRVEAELSRHADSLIEVERRFDKGPSFSMDAFRSAADGLRAILVEATAGRAVIESDRGLPPVERRR